MMKARKVIEKAPEKSRNIAKLGTFIDMTPDNSTVKHLYKMLLNYKRLIIVGSSYSRKSGYGRQHLKNLCFFGDLKSRQDLKRKRGEKAKTVH